MGSRDLPRSCRHGTSAGPDALDAGILCGGCDGSMGALLHGKIFAKGNLHEITRLDSGLHLLEFFIAVYHHISHSNCRKMAICSLIFPNISHHISQSIPTIPICSIIFPKTSHTSCHIIFPSYSPTTLIFRHFHGMTPYSPGRQLRQGS